MDCAETFLVTWSKRDREQLLGQYISETPWSLDFCIRGSNAIFHPVTMHNPLSKQACISTLNIPFIPSFNK